MDIEKVKKGLACCSIGLYCPDEECPYEVECISNLCRDAMELIEEYEGGRIISAPTKEPAQLMPRELLLHTWGHGWEENHLIGDDEDPETFEITECVWINGHIMIEDGRSADADSEFWQGWYNCTYGVRVWTGDEKPTEEQRKAAPWMNRQ